LLQKQATPKKSRSLRLLCQPRPSSMPKHVVISRAMSAAHQFVTAGCRAYSTTRAQGRRTWMDGLPVSHFQD
ncbi:hypothetical protein, partial [Stutzerimonas stutzeri]|uniref:hypothetical protein n=1 Tax=Stutzerimonas stutzeri TaxID=316 RepID=UPI000FBEB44D